MISRRLGLFWAFFAPFLSQKGLISRRLRRFARKNSQPVLPDGQWAKVSTPYRRKWLIYSLGVGERRKKSDYVASKKVRERPRRRRHGWAGRPSASARAITRGTRVLPKTWDDSAQVVDFPHLRRENNRELPERRETEKNFNRNKRRERRPRGQGIDEAMPSKSRTNGRTGHTCRERGVLLFWCHAVGIQ